MTTNHTTLKRRLSYILKLSYLCCGLAIAICPLTLIRYRPQIEVTQGHQYAWIPATVGLLLLAAILHKYRKYVGKRIVVKAAICTIINLLLVYGSFQHVKIGFATMMVCASRINTLGKAFITYAQDNNGTYPDANSWCDDLLKKGEVE